MARVAVAGWQHETNTFAPLKADFAAFERADEWPALCRGTQLLEHTGGVHLPITGAVQRLRELGHETVPLLWCAATPSAHVTQAAFERISDMLLRDLESALPVDGVYLDLHGAMVCEHLEDGDGEILRRVRATVGRAVPVVASLDLHANITAAMVANADALDAYRTYPHVDMGATGARTAEHLDALLTQRTRWHAALRKTDFLIPMNWGCTLVEPAGPLYRQLPQRVGGDVTALCLACGFPLADIAEVGPAVLAYGRNARAAEDAADALLEAVAACEDRFHGRLYDPAEAAAAAVGLARRGRRPVILADTQDNPGGGGPGDTTGVLRALVEAGAEEAVVGVIADAEVAAAAHAHGVGARLHARLGEKSAMPGHVPFEGTFEVLRLGNGRFTATGPMYRGARMELGPMALLGLDGVRVAVASKPVQAADQSIFRHVGVEPREQHIIALKSSVHFRADFQPLAGEILVVAAPGPVRADPSELPFRNVRPGLRLGPGVRAASSDASAHPDLRSGADADAGSAR